MEVPLFAKALHALVLQAGKSQRWLCGATRLSRTTVNRLVAGTQEPAANHMRAIASALPDWETRKPIVIARLEDVLCATGDQRRVLFHVIGADGEAHPLISPEFDGSLRLLADEILAEQHLPTAQRGFTAAIDALVSILTEVRAFREDQIAPQSSGNESAQGTAPSPIVATAASIPQDDEVEPALDLLQRKQQPKRRAKSAP
ncbi:hypothetical protein [Nibricoccus sp. IMCC34717]|uniref:hypothetical protein n=1 Tax=Nibricoccus sp. IMCC34717 TaxID=3034021 RepID=UPI00384C6639